jgi:MFS family permease
MLSLQEIIRFVGTQSIASVDLKSGMVVLAGLFVIVENNRKFHSRPHRTNMAALPAENNEPIYRRNFFYFLLDGILFSVAMSILDRDTVIPDFVRSLTDSEVLIGLSAALFEIGFTMPQLFIARYIVGSERKKWWFIGPNIPVRFIVLLFALLTVWLGAGQLSLILIAFLICWGIASFGDGLVGVPWIDLIGSSLNDKWRARMLGYSTGVTSLIMLAVAPLIAFILGGSGLTFPNNYALLFGISGVLFAISILPVLFVQEMPSGKKVEKLPAISEFLPSLLDVLKQDTAFRNLIFARIFIILFAMASPFYIGFATVDLGLSSEAAVPQLLFVRTIGVICGSFLFSWLGGRDNLLFVRLSILGLALVPIAALLAGVVGSVALYVTFFVLGLCFSNLFFGLQNWLITYASHEQRPIYTGLSNTIGAVVSLLTPFFAGTIAQQSGYQIVFILALGMLFVAMFFAMKLPNPQKQKNEMVEA